jgi:LAO/AO transport system kinase
VSTAAALAERVAAGDRRALARALSLIEDESPDAAPLVARLHPHSGRAWTIGVTGPPGAGKSTLVDRLTAALRASGATVGVLAVDPTSPFTGGAILGDRVRMQGHALDVGVFIRSMATRGHLGGLSASTAEAAQVLDASGFDYVIIETVGVGQDEVDVVRMADVCVVTLVPGTGDEVQALKAGIMEIADIFVVNKADREGADRMVAAIEAVLGLGTLPEGAWHPPVVKTVATTGEGLEALVGEIGRFRQRAAGRVAQRRHVRARTRLRELMAAAAMKKVDAAISGVQMDDAVERVVGRQVDPYTAAAALLAEVETPSAGGSRLDHIGVAVTDLDAAAAFYRDSLGLDVSDVHEVPTEQVRLRFASLGQGAIELLEATASASAIARSIEKRGPGIHHITLLVPDLDAALARLKARGVRLVDEAPRAGAHGSRVAFIHPSAAQGVLVELKQQSGGG